MKVNLSDSAGFCIGVQRAVDKAISAAEKNSGIYMLGDIVHNEFVVNLISEKGIKKIKKLGKGEGKTLLIRAHGSPLSVYKDAEKAGYKIIDATCPMVKGIHRLAKREEDKGRRLIIIGDREHEEVSGIKGALSKPPVIIDPDSPLPIKQIKDIRKASVIVQSTQNTVKVLNIVGRLSKIIEDLDFFDTICNPTKTRQKDAQIIPLKNDAVVVIGSKKSANTKRLYEISKGIHKNTYWISSPAEIKRSTFNKTKCVGVLAGASTPQEIIKEVVAALKSI